MKKCTLLVILAILAIGLVNDSPATCASLDSKFSEAVSPPTSDPVVDDKLEPGAVVSLDNPEYGMDISIGINIWDLMFNDCGSLDQNDDSYNDQPQLAGGDPDPEPGTPDDGTGDDGGWNIPDE